MTIGKGWVALGFLLGSLISPIHCKAAVSGDCSSCHTMHNSEQGKPVAFTRDSTGAPQTRDQPFVDLLKTDCVGCHTSPGSQTIVNMGEAVVPVVFNVSEPTYPPESLKTDQNSTLAGGNFHWVFALGEQYGHNVAGVTAAADSRYLTKAPGGEARTGECYDCHVTLWSNGSGCKGCHVPMHHADSAGDIADQSKGWFRFLGSVMQNRAGQEVTEGVVGIEASDWERTPTSTNHNTYQGKYITPPPQIPNPPEATYSSYLDSGSISQKCIGCHKLFHSETIADSTWIRHPVDVAIPDSGEFTGFTTYDPLVPVERPDIIDENIEDIYRGSDLVSCVSCHRAHGSPYPAMLRWGYRDWPGTDSHMIPEQPAINGCAVCHTSKS